MKLFTIILIFQDVGFTLRSVRLDFNLLEYLDFTMFVNTQYLSELSLSNNQLKILPDNTFAALANLTSLDLSFNPFITTNFKELLLNIPRLRILNLRSAGLYTVPTLFLNGKFIHLIIIHRAADSRGNTESNCTLFSSSLICRSLRTRFKQKSDPRSWSSFGFEVLKKINYFGQQNLQHNDTCS